MGPLATKKLSRFDGRSEGTFEHVVVVEGLCDTKAQTITITYQQNIQTCFKITVCKDVKHLPRHLFSRRTCTWKRNLLNNVRTPQSTLLFWKFYEGSSHCCLDVTGLSVCSPCFIQAHVCICWSIVVGCVASSEIPAQTNKDYESGLAIFRLQARQRSGSVHGCFANALCLRSMYGSLLMNHKLWCMGFASSWGHN